MKVYWLEQTQADVPEEDAWLSANEREFLRTLRFPKRRSDWLMGRWTAKNAVALLLDLPTDPEVLKTIEIRAATSGAPEVFVGNDPAAVTISLSHRAGVCVCAITAANALVGCDLEKIEPRSDAFASDYFTAAEQAFIAQQAADRWRLLALLWSAKESVLKALREGLRLDTRRVMVNLAGFSEGQGADSESVHHENPVVQSSFEDSSWSPLLVTHNGQIFHGWWSQTGAFVRTLVAAPRPDLPVRLSLDCSLRVQTEVWRDL